MAAICFTPADVYLFEKLLPNIVVSVEFVSAAWIKFTEAAPVPSIAFVERVLIKSRFVPHGVWVYNVLLVLFARVAFALADELTLSVEGTTVVMFGISVVAFIPIPAPLACSGRKKNAQLVTLEDDDPAPSIIFPNLLACAPLIALIMVCLAVVGVMLIKERVFVAVFKFNLVPSSST